jgi:epoxyqueuosine reductase
MNELKDKVKKFAKDEGMELCGIADAAVANKIAPPDFTPEDQLPGAKAVIIFAQRLPSGWFHATPGSLREKYYMRSWWSSFRFMDVTAYKMNRFLEEEGYPSIQIPANEPMRIYNGEPRGVVSLKHMGQLAGIGSIAMNSLLVNPDHGNQLRLGGLITKAPIPPDSPMNDEPCPDGCNECIKACPVNAIKDHSLDITTCMKLSLRHPLMQPYVLTKFLFRLSKRSKILQSLIEDFTNMLVFQFSESCSKCVVACKHFKVALKRGGIGA